jgi:exosome complex component CSL4
MSIPGYAVPGQIICPVIKKEDGVIRCFEPGQGVRLSDIGEAKSAKALVANVVGKVRLVSLDNKQQDDVIEVEEKSKKEVVLRFIVSVDNALNTDYALSQVESGNSQRSGTSFLPVVGDVVYGRITKISSLQANLEILVIENQGAVASDSGFGAFGSGEGLISGGAHGAGGGVSTTGDIGEGFGGIIRIQDVRETERDKLKMQNCFKPGDIVRATVLSLGDGNNYYLSTARNDLGVVFAKSAAGQQMYALDWETMKCSVTGKTESRKCAKPF